MKSILLLDSEMGYPGIFENSDVVPPAGLSKAQYIQQKIVNQLNLYNNIINVERVDCVDIKGNYDWYERYKYNGLLVEEFEICQELRQRYENEGCYVFEDNDIIICQKVIMYVFLSLPKEAGRTTFSQVFFPTLLDYAARFENSPSYTIANHPFIYINYINKRVSAKSILFPIVCLCSVGMQYVDVFQQSLNVQDIPNDFKEMVRKYGVDFDQKYDEAMEIYRDDYIDIDFGQKKVIWKSTKLVESDLDISRNDETGQATSVLFKGSQDKFHWLRMLPVSLAAWKYGYTLEYDNYESFLIEYEPIFSERAKDKIDRCNRLLKYVKKFYKMGD